MYVRLCYVNGKHAGACSGQERALELQELELHVVVSCLTWVLGWNLVLLKEQKRLLTTNLPLQVLKVFNHVLHIEIARIDPLKLIIHRYHSIKVT